MTNRNAAAHTAAMMCVENLKHLPPGTPILRFGNKLMSACLDDSMPFLQIWRGIGTLYGYLEANSLISEKQRVHLKFQFNVVEA